MYFFKNFGSLFEIKREAAACQPQRRTILPSPLGGRREPAFRTTDREKKAKAEANAEAKGDVFLNPDLGKQGLRDRCFFVALKYKRSVAEKIFQGAKKNIIFDTSKTTTCLLAKWPHTGIQKLSFLRSLPLGNPSISLDPTV
ncbi:hypothetical protein [Pseudomonas sp. NPDC089569]|uniref:hypothetical protein n=1 Tax=Pseudomonas sp. NPDC089569 TaxID=3390722 RepID=UPI003CFEF2FB